MIFYLVGFAILLYSFFDYKKGLMLYLAFKILLVQNITLISVPGIPLLTLDMFLGIFFCILYFIKRNKISKAKMSCPYITPVLFLVLTWLISSIFSVAGFMSEISGLVKNVIEELLLIIIIWESLETKKDFNFLFMLITIVILVSCVYGVYEYYLKSNPLLLYTTTLNKDPSKVIYWAYGANDVRGYHVLSVFEHPMGAGLTWGLYSIFVLSSIINYNEKLPLKPVAVITAIFCVLCIILTKHRSCLIFYFIGLFTFIKPKKKRLYILLIPVMAGMFLFADTLASNIDLVLSLFSSESQEKVGGSSLSMRIDQFDAAFSLWKTSPIWGLGSKYQNVISNAYTRRLLGSESIWLHVIPSYGLIGIIMYLFYAFWTVITVPRYFKCKEISIIMIAYWVTYTVSSVPGFKEYLLFLFVFYYIKKTRKYQSIEKRESEWSIVRYRVKHKHVLGRKLRWGDGDY